MKAVGNLGGSDHELIELMTLRKARKLKRKIRTMSFRKTDNKFRKRMGKDCRRAS